MDDERLNLGRGPQARGKPPMDPLRGSGRGCPLASDPTLVLLTLAIVLTSHLLGEKIAVGDGFGYDGQNYGKWARNFYHEVFVCGLDEYRIQRILPSALVHYTLRACSIPLTNASIIRCFEILNICCILLISLFFLSVGHQLNISFSGRCLGFLGLFLNFAVLKWSSYYPVLTDMPAYAIGMAMLDCYLARRTLGLCAAMILGAFTWPTAVYMGTLLLLFPQAAEEEAPAAAVRRWQPAACAAGAGLVLVCLIQSLLAKGYTLANGAAPPIGSVVHLSLLASLLYLFFGIQALVPCARPFRLNDGSKIARRSKIIISIILLYSLKSTLHRMSNHENFHAPGDAIAAAAFTSIAKPGIFFVAHVAFYGPLLILTVFVWKPTCRLIQRTGMGLTLCVALGLVLSLSSESRRVINFFPLLVPFAVKVTDSLRWRPVHYGLFAFLSLACSKVWLTINSGPFQADPLRFPDQNLFLNLGPWMSTEMYLVQGAAVLVCGLVLYGACPLKPQTG